MDFVSDHNWRDLCNVQIFETAYLKLICILCYGNIVDFALWACDDH